MTAPGPDRLLEVCVAAATAGGEVLTAGMSGAAPGAAPAVAMKSERASIVTEVDLESQRRVFGVIGEAFPGHAIMGEEGDGGGPDRACTWLVDPLDGTTNYASGIPFAAVSVAVRDTDGVVAGAIFDPYRGETFTAARGSGAFADGVPMTVRPEDDLTRAVVATGHQNDEPGSIAAHARRVEALHLHARGVRLFGCPSLAIAYVAAGRLDAYLECDGTFAWDVAAGSLMVAEAGGRCADLDGGPINLGRGIADVIATNGRVHDALADLLIRADHGG